MCTFNEWFWSLEMNTLWTELRFFSFVSHFVFSTKYKPCVSGMIFMLFPFVDWVLDSFCVTMAFEEKINSQCDCLPTMCGGLSGLVNQGPRGLKSWSFSWLESTLHIHHASSSSLLIILFIGLIVLLVWVGFCSNPWYLAVICIVSQTQSQFLTQW